MIVKSSLEALVSSVHSVHISTELWLHICTILSSSSLQSAQAHGVTDSKGSNYTVLEEAGKSLRRNMYFYLLKIIIGNLSLNKALFCHFVTDEH